MEQDHRLIRWLELRNFRRFEHLKLEFPERFSVLISANGKGKTTVLDALAMLLIPYVDWMNNGSGRKRFFHTEIAHLRMIDGEPRPQFPIEVLAETGLAVNNQWKVSAVKLRPQGGSDTLEVNFLGQELKAYAVDFQYSWNATSGVTLPLIAYYHASRHAHARYVPTKFGSDRGDVTEVRERDVMYWSKSSGLKDGYLDCLDPEVGLMAFMSWFKTFEDEVKKFDQLRDKALLAALKSAVRVMAPEWTDLHFSRKDNALKGIFKDGHETTVLNFFQLSEGYRGVIAMVADMAYRAIQLNPHLGENAVKETPGVVLIDELDLHLHPNWQRRIVANLKEAFPKVQFIATTHSPFIVQSLKREELIRLDAKNDDQEATTDPFRRSIEEIAEIEMGVEDVERSERFKEMMKVAERYYSLIGQGKTSNNDQEVAKLRDELNMLEEQFSEDPAFVAALKVERKAAGV